MITREKTVLWLSEVSGVRLIEAEGACTHVVDYVLKMDIGESKRYILGGPYRLIGPSR